ncbi:MAG: mechanosensitive ion channel [Gammaproteobacteria bacterium]|nr:mechanosensitive ion channel [Gammaproteobacteria bacterium]
MRLFIILLLLTVSVPALCETSINDTGKAVLKLEKQLNKTGLNEKLFKKWTVILSEAKQQAQGCIEEKTQQITKLKQDMESLGEVVKGEPGDVSRKRNELKKEHSDLEKQLSKCRLLLLQSEELLNTVNLEYKKITAARLFARGMTVVDILEKNIDQPAVWFKASREFVVTNSGLSLFSLTNALFFLLFAAAIYWFASSIRKNILTDLQRVTYIKSFSEYFNRALMSTLAHFLPHILISVMASFFAYTVTHKASTIPFVSMLAYGLPVYFILLCVIHVLFAPCKPASHIFKMPKKLMQSLAVNLKVLLTLIFIGYLFFATIIAKSLPENVLLFGREVYAVFFIAGILWLIRLLGGLPRFQHMFWLKFTIHIVLIAILTVELAGFRNLSVQSLRVLFGTSIMLGFLYLTQLLFKDMFYGLKHGTQPWHRSIRKLFGLHGQEHFPGILWLQVIINIGLWFVVGYAVLRIWGLSDTAINEVQHYVIDGFTIGSLRITPSRIIIAVASLALLLSFSGWFKNRLEKKWLPETQIERGAREAIVSISGYTGVILSAIISLGIAGLDFSNLAIIAGALSLGIGFGLQNIVNNFVSGIILLLERPVKTGDWIEVGATEGYVRKIRIRSTQIQTFDRADVIVPNSELISGQVTNWMLRDTRGRIKVPVGVAYGTDTEKVKSLLLALAASHAEVIKDDQSREIQVYFLAFGESSLDFELRCHIVNIDQRVSVISDLNFAIEKAFRENNIEIPFPQRDLHLHNISTKDLKVNDE